MSSLENKWEEAIILHEVMQFIEKLSWDTPDEEKSNAKLRLMEISDDDLHLLVLPISKAHWDGAAEVIVSLGYSRVHCILPGLLEWIQDLNWPGAEVIADKLYQQFRELIAPQSEIIKGFL